MKKKGGNSLVFQAVFLVILFFIGYLFITSVVDKYNLNYHVMKDSVSCGNYQCAVETDNVLNSEYLKFENNLLYFTYDNQVFTSYLAFTVVNDDAEQYINQILTEGSKIQVTPIYIANGSYVSYINYTVSGKTYFLQEILLKKNLVDSVNTFNLNKDSNYAILESLSLDNDEVFDNSDIYGAFDEDDNGEIKLINNLNSDDKATNSNSDSLLTNNIGDYVNSFNSNADVINENIDTKLSSKDVTDVVDACDLNGDRKSNAIVDIGYDSNYANRDYYAMTNNYEQLIYVYADEIIVQNDREEDVTSQGRYCYDEAKVSGTEASDLDEGHAIADSLGGVSNSYNITPQNSTLNRSGKQYKMEDEIRNAIYDGGEVTDFQYFIEYPNTSTKIPSRYYGSYILNGKEKTFDFSNA